MIGFALILLIDLHRVHLGGMTYPLDTNERLSPPKLAPLRAMLAAEQVRAKHCREAIHC